MKKKVTKISFIDKPTKEDMYFLDKFNTEGVEYGFISKSAIFTVEKTKFGWVVDVKCPDCDWGYWQGVRQGKHLGFNIAHRG
jgi:hypothetical protein